MVRIYLYIGVELSLILKSYRRVLHINKDYDKITTNSKTRGESEHNWQCCPCPNWQIWTCAEISFFWNIDNFKFFIRKVLFSSIQKRGGASLFICNLTNFWQQHIHRRFLVVLRLQRICCGIYIDRIIVLHVASDIHYLWRILWKFWVCDLKISSLVW